MRHSNQTQALELERANTKKYQDAVESERQRSKLENHRLLENIEGLRRQLAATKQEKADLEVQLEREKISRSRLESELETSKSLQGEASGKLLVCLFAFAFALVESVCPFFCVRGGKFSYLNHHGCHSGLRNRDFPRTF